MDKEVLFNQYKLYSDEELKEITVANGYTEEAEQIARRILGGDRGEYKEYIMQEEQEEQEEGQKEEQEEEQEEQEEEQEEQQEENDMQGNMISGVLKAIGFLILIIGTIGSFYIASQGYEFSFASFILPEIGTIVSGMLFLGFSEVIRLLQDIKDKL